MVMEVVTVVVVVMVVMGVVLDVIVVVAWCGVLCCGVVQCGVVWYGVGGRGGNPIINLFPKLCMSLNIPYSVSVHLMPLTGLSLVPFQ